MKVRVIGCGNAFSNLNFNQSFLLEENGRKLLIDCGYQIQAALNHQGIDVKEIDDIYISHPHADHIGGLEYFAFMRYDWVTKPRPKQYNHFRVGKAPRLFCEKQLLEYVWEHSLSGGLDSMEGFKSTLSTFFEPKPIEPDIGFNWQGWYCRVIQQIHVMAGSKIMHTYGLFMERSGHPTIYFTTDSQHCSPAQVEVFYDKADVIFQDCEISPFLSKVHANYIELAGYPEANQRRLRPEIKKKMKLSHYQDFKNTGKKMVVKGSDLGFYRAPDDQEGFVGFVDFDWDAQAKADGFDEFISVGKEYTF